MRLLVLRPEPGASETAARALALGLDPLVAPLFAIESLPHPPIDPAAYDAVLLTSANGARHGSLGLTALPCFAVGEATAAAARAAGFRDVRAGPSDGKAAVAMMAEAGARRAIHPCGLDHVRLEHPAIRLEQRSVYAAEPLPVPPAVLAEAALALVHSPRAGRRLAAIVADRSIIALAAISPAAAEAAGTGWAATEVAAEPRDDALLELAAKLCKDERSEAE